MTKESLQNQFENTKTAEYSGGSIDYSVVGESNAKHNPVMLVAGFTEGRIVLQNFGVTLSEMGDRQVIIPEQPDHRHLLTSLKRGQLGVDHTALDHQAEAVLAILKDNELSNTPVDFIAHSFGALILARAAYLAKLRHMTCFESKRGSHSVFIAPAGTNSNEHVFSLGTRFAKFSAASIPDLRTLDPSGEISKASLEHVAKHPMKVSREARVLAKNRIIYEELGKVGLRPLVLTYANDILYPDQVIAPTIEKNLAYTEGWGVPINRPNNGASYFGADSLEEFREKSGWRPKMAKKAYVHHYSNSGHNDLLFHPDRTARSVLQILDQRLRGPEINVPIVSLEELTRLSK